MPSSQHTRAFVLRTVAYGDADVIVTLLGRDTGRFSAIARAARNSRKRFAGGLQPLRCLQASFTRRPQRDLATLTEITVVGDYPGLETSFDKIAAASYATELVRELSREDEADPHLFDLLEAFYDHLGQVADDASTLEATLRHFELRLLEVFGALPALDGCARCGVTHDTFDKLTCSRNGEGLLCHHCRHPTEAVGVVHPDTLALLRHYVDQVHAPATPPAPVAAQQARRVIQTSFAQILDRELKTLVTLQTLDLA